VRKSANRRLGPATLINNWNSGVGVLGVCEICETKTSEDPTGEVAKEGMNGRDGNTNGFHRLDGMLHVIMVRKKGR